ncbi:MAG: hypothetical protein RSE00_00010 [Clostridia bacterium]
MYINPKCFLNSFFCCSNMKIPMYKGHYMTGSDISFFSKLMCVENTLTNISCNAKQLCSNCKSHKGNFWC